MPKTKPSPRVTKEKLEVFTNAIMVGENSSDAYRIMHPPSRKWRNETVHSKATTWFNCEQVQERLAEKRKEIAEIGKITVEKKQARLWQLALGDHKSTSVAAIRELNLMDGHHAPKENVNINKDGDKAYNYMSLESQRRVLELVMNKGFEIDEAISQVERENSIQH